MGRGLLVGVVCWERWAEHLLCGWPLLGIREMWLGVRLGLRDFIVW